MKDHEAKTSTNIDVQRLIGCDVTVQGAPSPLPLRDVLSGDSTILLFVRNGA